MKLNPKGEVPVLKDGVKIIPDSTRIIDYLEDNFSNGSTPRLTPERGTENAQKVKEMRELLDSVPIGLITNGCIYNQELTSEMKLSTSDKKARLTRFPQAIEILDQYANDYPDIKEHYLVKKKEIQFKLEQARNVYQVKKALDDLENLLNIVEDELLTHIDDKSEYWLCTENFTIADISLAVLLNRLLLLGLWNRYFGEGKRPNISTYFKKLQQKDCHKKTFNHHNCIFSSISCMGIHGKCFATAVSIASMLGIAAIAVILYRRSKF